MTILSGVIHVEATDSKVWDVLSDLKGIAKWSPVVRSASVVTDTDKGEGARRRLKGVNSDFFDETITEWDDGVRLVYKVEGANSLLQSVHAGFLVSPSDEGATLVTYTVHYQPRWGIAGTIADKIFLRRSMCRKIGLNLAGLKHHVETGELIETELPEVLKYLHRVSMANGSNSPVWCLSASCQESVGNTVSGRSVTADLRAKYDLMLR